MDRFQFCASLVCGAALAALPRAAFAQATPAQRLDTPRAIDMAGRLRMLSQRCTKAYLQSGQSIASHGARTLLQESVSRYEAHLAALKTFMPNPAVQASLPQLQTLWSQFKALLIGEPAAPARRRCTTPTRRCRAPPTTSPCHTATPMARRWNT